MEAAAGSALFERAPRGVRLTEAGRVLLGHAGTVLDVVDAADRELAGLRSLASGRVRLGAFATSVAALVPRAVAAFRSGHPGVVVALREGTSASQLRRVVAGSTDVAVVAALPGMALEEGRVALEPLMEDPLLLAVARSHRLARRRSVAVDDLAGEAWVAGSTDPRETLLGAWRWSSWEPDVRYVAREWTAKLGLVAAGLGVTLVPSLAATAVRRDVALLRLRGGDQPATRSVVLATRAGVDPAPAASALAEALHETAAELSAELQRLAARQAP
jgi:DNA-binding transcriptional LysR family regulator